MELLKEKLSAVFDDCFAMHIQFDKSSCVFEFLCTIEYVVT